MAKAYETFEHAGFRVSIHQDEDASAPENGNNDLFLVTTRNRHFVVQRKGFELDSIRDGEHKKDYHALPLFAYIHSGVALSLWRGGQFSDPWDSGQIGYVLVKKRQGFRNIRKAAESLMSEWNQYLSGDVWGYIVEDADGNNVDSCWGFYGLEYVQKEARESAEYARKHETEESSKIEACMHV